MGELFIDIMLGCGAFLCVIFTLCMVIGVVKYLRMSDAEKKIRRVK